MKKSILLIIAALFFSLGNQQFNAQERVGKEMEQSKVQDLERSALKQTKTLQRQLVLTKEQQEDVYQLYLDLGKKMNKYENLEKEQQTAVKAKMDDYMDYKLKEILTSEQYTKFQEVKKKL